MSAVGPVDHIAYLVDDLDAGIRGFSELLGLDVTREVDLPQFTIRAAFVGTNVEVITFTDSELTARRLNGATSVVDHVAYLVSDIDAVSARLRAQGLRFGGPNLVQEVDAPLEIGGARHLWSFPDTVAGHSIQLVERPA